MKKGLILLLVLLTALGLVGCGKNENIISAETAIQAIGNVTLDSESTIIAAEKAVSILTDEEAKKMEYSETLETARKTFDDLVLADKALKIDTKISEIGSVTLDSISAIEAARKAYDAADANVKDKVKKYADLTASEKMYAELSEKVRIEEAKQKASKVSDAITAIGEVTLDSKDSIATIRQEYDALTTEEQSFVSNANDLTVAENLLKQLKDAEKERKLAILTDSFNLAYDKVQGITWYTPKVTPKYIDIRSYLIPCIGVRDNGDVWICACYNYTSDSWIFWDNLTIMIDGEKIDKFVGRSNIIRDNDTEIWEYYDEALPVNAKMDNSDIQLLKKIADSEETIIRFRGDKYYDDLIVQKKDKDAILDVLSLYEMLLD